MEHIGLTTICQGPSSLFLPAGIWGFSRAEKADSAIAKDIWRTATLPLLEIMVTVGGDENGEFHPNDDMIRSSVVMMMNRILGRFPVCSTQKENPFTDIAPGFWAYDNILEAAVSHEVR